MIQIHKSSKSTHFNIAPISVCYALPILGIKGTLHILNKKMFVSSWHDIIVNLIYSTCSCTIGLIIKRVVIFDKYLTIDKRFEKHIIILP